MSAWSLFEVEAVVADYFAMLDLELAGAGFNKADRNRRLRKLLDSRSAGSVEFKHQNISAILVNHALPYIAGYKPRQNYQALLERVVLTHIESDRDWARRALRSRAFSSTDVPETDFDRLSALEEAPPERRPSKVRIQPRPVQIDFVEQRRLHDIARRPDLSRLIRHVSADEGDGLGYDIQSFDVAGNPILIEVKTTGLGKSFPFYVSRNELQCSKREASRYQLYRVFEFSKDPRLFKLKGDLEAACNLQPVNYRAVW